MVTRKPLEQATWLLETVRRIRVAESSDPPPSPNIAYQPDHTDAE